MRRICFCIVDGKIRHICKLEKIEDYCGGTPKSRDIIVSEDALIEFLKGDTIEKIFQDVEETIREWFHDIKPQYNPDLIYDDYLLLKERLKFLKSKWVTSVCRGETDGNKTTNR